MKVGLLLSGGKDSMYAGFLAKKSGHEISCLISVVSSNKESYMFHTPSIDKVRVQAEVMGIPLIIVKTKGEKEKELIDLEKGIVQGIDKYRIEGVVTGAVGSVYQASRIQKICDNLKVECINPLWGKEQIELLNNLVKDKFEVIIVGVFAYPLDEKWLGRKIDDKYIKEVKKLEEKWGINVAGEGGEFESFVLNCPLFKKGLKVRGFKDIGEKNSWRREIEVE
jgi:ABC transporter with metal-binding/Fe-S-binding domain ATP-binding protein